jgi:hypothetical protein
MVQFLVLIDMVQLKLAYKLMDLHIFRCMQLINEPC